MAIAEWVLTGGLLAGIGYMCVRSLVSSGRRGRLHLLALRRAPRARRAAAEAALDDPVFAPERIEAAVTTILGLTETLWHHDSERRLRGRPDEGVIRAWAQNSAAVLGGEARLTGRPRVDILNVVNRERETEDRVVVRVRTHVDRGPHLPVASRHVPLEARWTLMHRGDTWYMAAAAGDPLAPSLLRSPLIASPRDDHERLREQSLEELTGHHQAAGPGPGELIDPDAAPLQQLEDLSVADERFDPMLIEATIRHIVEAWEASADGSDAPLLAVASGPGAHALNFPHPGEGRRRVRDARLQRWEVARVNADATPPSVEARISVKAAAWMDGHVRAGDDRHARRLDLVWTLALDDEARQHPHWRLTNSADAR